MLLDSAQPDAIETVDLRGIQEGFGFGDEQVERITPMIAQHVSEPKRAELPRLNDDELAVWGVCRNVLEIGVLAESRRHQEDDLGPGNRRGDVGVNLLDRGKTTRLPRRGGTLHQHAAEGLDHPDLHCMFGHCGQMNLVAGKRHSAGERLTRIARTEHRDTHGHERIAHVGGRAYTMVGEGGVGSGHHDVRVGLRSDDDPAEPWTDSRPARGWVTDSA